MSDGLCLIEISRHDWTIAVRCSSRFFRAKMCMRSGIGVDRGLCIELVAVCSCSPSHEAEKARDAASRRERNGGEWEQRRERCSSGPCTTCDLSSVRPHEIQCENKKDIF
jgi:hypothetical protein